MFFLRVTDKVISVVPAGAGNPKPQSAYIFTFLTDFVYNTQITWTGVNFLGSVKKTQAKFGMLWKPNPKKEKNVDKPTFSSLQVLLGMVYLPTALFKISFPLESSHGLFFISSYALQIFFNLVKSSLCRWTTTLWNQLPRECFPIATILNCSNLELIVFFPRYLHNFCLLLCNIPLRVALGSCLGWTSLWIKIKERTKNFN